MKTRIKIRLDDARAEKRYVAGETGYIYGYLPDRDGTPLIAVVLGNRIVFVQPYVIEVIK